jgi:hypothetical protein
MSRMVKDLYVILCMHPLLRAAGESRFNDFVPPHASPARLDCTSWERMQTWVRKLTWSKR